VGPGDLRVIVRKDYQGLVQILCSALARPVQNVGHSLLLRPMEFHEIP
jgi:hypothetical protein